MRHRDRNIKQIDANEIDLDVFRVVQKLDRFANLYRDEPAREMAAAIDGMRERVRKHMHRDDREGTR